MNKAEIRINIDNEIETHEVDRKILARRLSLSKWCSKINGIRPGQPIKIGEFSEPISNEKIHTLIAIVDSQTKVDQL